MTSRRPQKLADVLRDVHEIFNAAPLHYGHGTDNAWDEAVALVLGVAGLPDVPSSLDVLIDAASTNRISDLAERRVIERLPLAYLLGETTYCGETFRVVPGVIVPRSPLGLWLCDGAASWVADSPGRILDLCCGSGAIGIVAAKQFVESQVVLADTDALAISIAADNVTRHGLDERVEVVCSDLFASLSREKFDLILCNPPYVDVADMEVRPPEHHHEPDRGLAGGDDDGLRLVRRILAESARYLSEQGLLVCEVGYSARHLLPAYPNVPFIWPDLPGGGEGVFLADQQVLSKIALAAC